MWSAGFPVDPQTAAGWSPETVHPRFCAKPQLRPPGGSEEGFSGRRVKPPCVQCPVAADLTDVWSRQSPGR